MVSPCPERDHRPFSLVITSSILLLCMGVSRAHAGDETVVVAWNDLGMHCCDDDYSVFSLLPPFNTVYAQVMRYGNLVSNPTGLTVTYQAIADPSGSINKTSANKTEFWQYVTLLYGASPLPDMGLAGHAMPGAANTPQALPFDFQEDAFIATGIPITPYDDNLARNTYPMMRITVRDAGSQVLATTDVVLPVSDEMDCRACHASGSHPEAEPTSGWVNHPDPDKDHRLNILLLHDFYHAWNPTYATILAQAGYNTGGLYLSATVDLKPVLCAACHTSNALPGYGIAGTKPLTQSIHGAHAYVEDPVSSLTLNDINNRSACYSCHPGSETRCLRGAMGAAVAANGSLEMQCQDCHGQMSDVASPNREGWLDEPACQSCHTGTATSNNGKIRYTSAFESPGNYRVAVNSTFATDPNTPSAGYSLYRFSTGHGDLLCSACHGSTHAIYPSSHASDNVQNIALQGEKGTLGECAVCHDGSSPHTVTGGPHGMHPVGKSWISDHDHAGKTQCRACHGADYRGSVLSEAFTDRTISTEAGKLTLWRGFRVTCYSCHNGPNSESKNGNHPAKVKSLSATTDNFTPITIKLEATDSDGDKLEVRIIDQPASGTVGLSGKKATYYPEAGFVGTVKFTYAAFDGDTDSNLAKVTVTVEEAGCPVKLAEKSHVFDAAGGSLDLGLDTPAGCNWTAVVDAGSAAWLSITAGSTGTGPGVISYLAAANAGNARVGTLTVGEKTHTVTQGGADSADLVGSFKKVKEKTQGGGKPNKVKVTFKLQNTGGKTAPASTLNLYLSADGVLDGGDTLLKAKSFGKVKPGKTSSKKFTVKLPAGVTGSGKYLIGVADANDDVPEADGTNNVVVFGPLP